MDWLLKGAMFGGVRNYVLVAGVLAFVGLLWAFVAIADNAIEDSIEAGEDIGRAEERVKNTEEVLRRVEQGTQVNEGVHAEVRAGGSCRIYEQCLRALADEGNADNCLRFLPSGGAVDCQSGSVSER